MKQGKKSERSRAAILDAALRLFSSQGYRGTSIRDVAEKAGVSTGNVYHHFSDKETIFQTLLDQYWAEIDRPDFPFNAALAAGTFPENLESLARASKQSVEKHRRYVALIYVDVVELSGNHIRKFYSDMAGRFERFLERQYGKEGLSGRLRPGVSPATAVILASRIFLHYYAVEILFGVPRQFGKDSDAVMREIAEILRHGMLRGADAPEPVGARALRADG